MRSEEFRFESSGSRGGSRLDVRQKPFGPFRHRVVGRCNQKRLLFAVAQRRALRVAVCRCCWRQISHGRRSILRCVSDFLLRRAVRCSLPFGAGPNIRLQSCGMFNGRRSACNKCRFHMLCQLLSGSSSSTALSKWKHFAAWRCAADVWWQIFVARASLYKLHRSVSQKCCEILRVLHPSVQGACYKEVLDGSVVEWCAEVLAESICCTCVERKSLARKCCRRVLCAWTYVGEKCCTKALVLPRAVAPKVWRRAL